MPPVGFEPKISAGERSQAAHLLSFGELSKLYINRLQLDRNLSCDLSDTRPRFGELSKLVLVLVHIDVNTTAFNFVLLFLIFVIV